MQEKNRSYKIFISAAEPSADAHCAALITAINKSRPDIEFVGIGGPKMASAGCQLLESNVAKATMAYNAFGHIGYYYKLIRRISAFFKRNKLDLVIVCDSPAFNFHIAKAAKKAGLKTIFYVAPQLWAWAGWRIRKLRRYCNKLCCILPFEQEWFNKKGVDAIFVGNPLLDASEINISISNRNYDNFEPQRAIFVLLPGSRTAEIASLWLPMQKIAIRLKQIYHNSGFITVAVDNDRLQLLKSKQLSDFDCRYSLEPVIENTAKADFAISASGSATLQAAAAGCPMVVMYHSSRMLWHLIGRWLIKTKYLSLVNILADRSLVPEFMPYFSSIEPILESIHQVLNDKERLTFASRELLSLSEQLNGDNAARKVADVVTEMLSRHETGPLQV
ncbi:MAG: lipid-A-disaccharide synthase [Sedimentisphaerales bacterium]|nr:lipid-A-disaccharide synthase [Sedimentisphaerales bacterium]